VHGVKQGAVHDGMYKQHRSTGMGIGSKTALFVSNEDCGANMVSSYSAKYLQCLTVSRMHAYLHLCPP
jgi:hypothetical protein